MNIRLALLIMSALLAGCRLSPGEPGPGGAGELALSRDALVFNAGGDIESDTRTLTLTNEGDAALELSLSVTGEGASYFTLSESAPLSLAAGESLELELTFTPSADDLGPQIAALQLSAAAEAEVYLGGLSVFGQEGTNEPSLQWIFDTFGFPIESGDADPTTYNLTEGSVNAPVGDGIVAQTFGRADASEPVTVEVLSAFGVADVAPVYAFGYYAATEGEPTLQRLFEVPIGPNVNGQRLEPVTTPAVATVENGIYSFEPAAGAFGFYSYWPTTPFFDERNVFSEDARNTFPNAAPFQVRVYPFKDRSGDVVPNAYILTTDESARLFDYNDAVVIVRNVRPFGM